MSRATAGAVAGGSPLTVEAGLEMLRRGGNAVDAAVAASLMACVAEPLLTGLGGAGIALVRMQGEVRVCDMFANAPGLRDPEGTAPLMHSVDVDYGPTTQRFRVGPASAAVPGMPAGLHRLHELYGSLPMIELAQPAVLAAHKGVQVSVSFERVARLLWPILKLTAEAASMIGPAGRPLRAGEIFRSAALGDTIAAFARQGPSLFVDGAVGKGIAELLDGRARMGLEDLAAYRPVIARPLGYRYRDATVWIPGPPSAAGILVLQSLRALEDHGRMPPALGASQVRFLAHAMERAEKTRVRHLKPNLFRPGWSEGFLAALAADETGEELLLTANNSGHTTHISVVDEHGNAVGITSSLGETCGSVVPGTGVLLNNFLGETDVNPAEAAIGAGKRLMTMCCPTILQLGDEVYVMGSGGSSRIRSAILHGIVYLTDHDMRPDEAVVAPRAHSEGGWLHVETDGRPAGTMESLGVTFEQLKRFDGSNMFFGGLHVAGVSPEGFMGAGDPRRSGCFGQT